jgi:MFS family permease
MLFYIPAGVLVDRWNPRRVLLSSEFLRGIAIASVVVSLGMFGTSTSILFLIAAMVAEEILEIFSTLADRRYLSRLMERDKIAASQAYIEVRVHAAVLAGRPIGPWLFSIKPLLPFLADGLSFFFSVGSILLLRGGNEAVRKPERMSVRQLGGEVGQGFKWLWRNRRDKMTVTFMAMTSLIAQALIMMFLAEAHAKELSTMGIGVVLAASGAGGALGAVTVRVMPADVKRRWSVIKNHWVECQLIAWSIAIGLLAIAGGGLSVWCSAVAMFTLGFTGAIGNIAFGTYLVTNVPDEMLARVTGICQVLAIGACALGPVMGGAAIQFYGPKDAVWVLFGFVASAALLAFALGYGIVRKILDTMRWSFFSAVISFLTLLRDDVILTSAQFIHSLVQPPKREMDNAPGSFSPSLANHIEHQIVDHDRQCNARR